jgi:hypothetical protein
VPLEKLVPGKLAHKLLTDSDTRRSITLFTTVSLLAVPNVMNPEGTVPSYSFKTCFSIALPSVSGSSKWSPFLRFSLHNPTYLSVLVHISVIRRCINLQIDSVLVARRHAPVTADRSALARMREYFPGVNRLVTLGCSAVAMTRNLALIVGQRYLPVSFNSQER